MPKTDQFGRLTEYRDFAGKIQPVRYPKGKTYAVCGAVSMITQAKKSYAVVYGLQIKENLTREDAATEFGRCVCHQGECQEYLQTAACP